MIDLKWERALIDELYAGDKGLFYWNEEDIRRIAKAIAAARREGAEEMRERALEAARDGVQVAFGERRDQEFIDQNDVIGSIEDAFASTLPLTPEEP